MWRAIAGALFGIVVFAATDPASAANCALYARAETGVALYGAAGGWWAQAAGRYQRGRTPEVGAILAFERTRHMPSGHVAVVARILSKREILVDQDNWYRGRVTRDVSVIDTSPDNDWTSVSVLDLASGRHGRDNPTFGFIYPDREGTDIYVGEQKAPAAAGLVRLAVARGAPLRPHRQAAYAHRAVLRRSHRRSRHARARRATSHLLHRIVHRAKPHRPRHRPA